MMRTRLLTAAAACFLVATLAPARASAQTEVVEYYALDAIGSVRVVFDDTGSIKSRRDYGPFGEAITSIATDPKIYAQLFRDDESKLDYAQARMFQSHTGRFTAVDPVYAGLFKGP
jgi:RHS repeat-associated protein